MADWASTSGGTPEILICKDAAALAREAAGVVVSEAQRCIGQRGRFTFALSGGSTPRVIYGMLAQQPLKSQVDWSRVHFFWGDERSVSVDHADSNYRMAREVLLDDIGAPPEHIHRMEAEREDRDAAAAEYQATIEKVFGVHPPQLPRFDLIWLGMGDDGHTVSLFPGTSALHETTRWVVPNFVPKFNTFRMTFTAPLINNAALVIFLVVGEGKATVLQAVLRGPREPERLPSQLIRPTAGRLVWMSDQSAARML